MRHITRIILSLVLFEVIIFSAVSLAFSLHPTSCASDSQPTIDGILDRYIKALGGKEAIEKIRTHRLRGELTHDFPGQNPPKTVLPAEVIAATPDKWRLILKTASGLQQMGFDGQRGWRQDADRVLIDDQQERSRLAYLFHPQAAIRLGDYFSGLSLPEKVVTEGRAEYAVKATDAGGTQRTLYFDIESGLLSRLGENILVKGYHRELGVLHPDHIVIAREGGTSTYVFNDIAANIAIEDARFALPTLGEVFPDVFEGLEDPRIVPLLKDFPSVHEDMNIPCRDGRFLYDLILRNGYKKGLEIGTFTGYSALWMGWAFKKNGGRLITIEVDSGPGEKARQNIQRAGLESVVDPRIADAFAEIPKIAREFDFVFIDAWKPDYLKFLHLLRGRVSAGGVIVAHNVTNYARDMRDYLAAIQQDAGLETTFNEGSAEGMSISKILGPNLISRDSRRPANVSQPGRWADKPQDEWPQITMINQIEYVDRQFPIAACSFLLETEKGVFAVTAKHVLTFFKSASMTSVSFGDSLKNWVMFPKNNPADSVVIDALINENPDEPINQICPSSVDWLLFSIKSRSDNIQPLKFRSQPLEPREKVYIVGWRYSDKDCPQVIYEANYIESQDGAVIISTKTLQDNRMPGLSGAPVIDAHGDLIGIMSQKYGKMERLGSIDYPKRIIAEKYR